MSRVNPYVIRELARSTGCSVVDCSRALKVCDDKEGVAAEYLKLKSQPLVRKKLVKGRWVSWSEKDYVKEANERYFGTKQK